MITLIVRSDDLEWIKRIPIDQIDLSRHSKDLFHQFNSESVAAYFYSIAPERLKQVGQPEFDFEFKEGNAGLILFWLQKEVPFVSKNPHNYFVLSTYYDQTLNVFKHLLNRYDPSSDDNALISNLYDDRNYEAVDLLLKDERVVKKLTFEQIKQYSTH